MPASVMSLPHFALSLHLPRKFQLCITKQAVPYGFARAERKRIDPRYREKLTISTQFGFFPIGYSLSLVSLPVALSIA